MNCTEHIVEAYFRLCRRCFTMTDVKVEKGNNRQFDLLAVNVKKRKRVSYHVEVSVKHGLNWRSTKPKYLKKTIERKFCGLPREKTGKGSDHMQKRCYKDRLYKTYKSLGIRPARMERVWVCWALNPAVDWTQMRKELKAKTGFDIELLSFRDVIVPKLQRAIGTANYDDEVLRAFSLLAERERQTAKNREAKDERVSRRMTRRGSRRISRRN